MVIQKITSKPKKRSRIVSSVAMMLILPILIPGSFASIKANPPVYDDYYLPQIVKYSTEVLANVDSDSNGQQFWNVSVLADIQFKVHRNSVAKIVLNQNYVGNSSSATCAIFFGVRESLPGPYGGNLVTAGDLVNRQQQGDWYLETHRIEIPVLKNSYKRPCVGDYVLLGLQVIDTAGHFKAILTDKSIPNVLFYEALSVGPAPSEIIQKLESFLPEYSCPRVNVGIWKFSPIACLDSALKNHKVTIDTVILDKAAADKAAADARAAANKKTTITCIKGKLTKKVTAIKPKCPKGYKVKK